MYTWMHTHTYLDKLRQTGWRWVVHNQESEFIVLNQSWNTGLSSPSAVVGSHIVDYCLTLRTIEENEKEQIEAVYTKYAGVYNK